VTPHRSGFAALVGRPNVGKSTLLNALVGQKLSIVTPRPQTTRHRILGIYTSPTEQIAFVDTPGLHREAARALNKAMNRLLPYLAELAARHPFLAVVPVSAQKGDNVEALRQVIRAHLPPGPVLFPDGELTDRSVEFRIAEMIREKLTLELNQEVPYGIAVEVERLSREEGQLSVDAAIWVDREGQKPIVIGAKGARLKRVGTAARLALNALLQERLHLNLWVKVRENWADNARALKELGLE
jgi:GTP-binding protein Era